MVAMQVCNLSGVLLSRVAGSSKPRNYQESPHTKDLMAKVARKRSSFNSGTRQPSITEEGDGDVAREVLK